MKRIQLLTVFMLVFITPPIAHAAEETVLMAGIKPPELVECKTPATCDRDPKHLEKFVADFYKWYIGKEVEFESIPWSSSPSKEQKDLLNKFVKTEEDIYRKLLSPSFYKWKENVSIEMDYTNYKYCSPGTNTLLCAQDFNEKWASNASAKIVKLEQNSAILTVDLPQLGDNSMHLILSVELKLINGQWLINAVKSI
jgi:hypothetical protein